MTFPFHALKADSAKLRHKMDWTASDKRGVIRAFHDHDNCELCALLRAVAAAHAEARSRELAGQAVSSQLRAALDAFDWMAE